MSEHYVHPMRAFRLGVGVGQLRALFAEHDWRCDICAREWDDEKVGGGLVVDHDHSCCGSQDPKVAYGERPRRLCGKCIRGVLCHGCNNALGALGDEPARLRRAADYLERPLVEVPEVPRASPRGKGHGSVKLTEDQVR